MKYTALILTLLVGLAMSSSFARADNHTSSTGTTTTLNGTGMSSSGSSSSGTTTKQVCGTEKEAEMKKIQEKYLNSLQTLLDARKLAYSGAMNMTGSGKNTVLREANNAFREGQRVARLEMLNAKKDLMNVFKACKKEGKQENRQKNDRKPNR